MCFFRTGDSTVAIQAAAVVVALASHPSSTVVAFEVGRPSFVVAASSEAALADRPWEVVHTLVAAFGAIASWVVAFEVASFRAIASWVATS